jgi:predicted transcriptional regulator of viral defense system/very-short-patch-repair endonuclease
MRAQITARDRWLTLMALAAEQHWIVTIAELIELGFSRSAIARLVQARRLHPLHRGVYVVGHPDASREGRRLAAVKACGEGALLSFRAAGAHHGLRESQAARIDVTVPGDRRLSRSGIRIHRCSTLITEDRTMVDAIPCTSVARTLLDLASLIDDRGVERALERAEILEVYDHRQIVSLLGRLRGHPGTPRLARVAEAANPGTTISRSDLEEALLRVCRCAGLPEPELNQSILLGGVHTEVDFLWRAERVIVEVDSWKYHRQRGQFRRDRRRDQLLELEGWGHARFTDTEVKYEATHVEGVIRRLLSSPGTQRRVKPA